MYGEENKLVGVKVTGLKKEFKQGDESITFITDKGEFTLGSEGDCCSHSWFEHMELPDFPFTIQSSEEVPGINLPEPIINDDYYYHDCIQTYGYKMTTDKGYVDIDMRNSSNGYYGGHFSLDLDGLNV